MLNRVLRDYGDSNSGGSIKSSFESISYYFNYRSKKTGSSVRSKVVRSDNMFGWKIIYYDYNSINTTLNK